MVLSFAALLSSRAGRRTPAIVIPAGTPEDKDLAAIAAESDAQKRIAAYQEFLTKYADNKPAMAYAEWQLSQQYLAAGDTAKAMEYGNKALEAYPNNLDIIMSQASMAQAMKDNGKVVDYAVQGAGVFHSIAKQAKPADVSDAEWTTRISSEENAARNAYDFLETSAYNAIASEQDPNKRMSEIEKFTPAFPKSKFEDQITQLALYSLRQLNQPQRLMAYGEKTLAANPDSLPTLMMMADAYAGDPKEAAKAATYAKKVLSLVGLIRGEDKTKRSYAGLAHITLGRAELNQEKLIPAIADLKSSRDFCKRIPRTSNRPCITSATPMPSRTTRPMPLPRCRKQRLSTAHTRGPLKKCWRRCGGPDRQEEITAAGPMTDWSGYHSGSDHS